MKKLLFIIPAVLLLTIVMCMKDNTITPLENGLNAKLKPRTIDTTYVPLLWGSSLRIVPRVLIQGKYKKKDYWFAQTFAYSKVTPANYQQDSVRERVVVADTFPIVQSDTFYICRRVVK